MKIVSARIAVMLAAALGTPLALAAASVATVNGQPIPQARADALMAEQKAQGRPESPQLKDAVKEELVRREVMVQAAKSKGLDKKPEVQAQMDLARQAILIRAYIQDYVATNPVAEGEIRKAYDEIKNRAGDKEYKVRHILVDSEDEAKAIITKLQTGEKFEALAAQSKDSGSKDKGGELGWANPGMFVKPFSEAMVKLKKGKFTGVPVKSDFGYHVIQLDDVRELKAPSYDEVKGQLSQRLQEQQVQKHMLDLRGRAKVE